MPNETQIKKHRRLLSQMADVVNADLDEAELRGDLTPDARNAMVQSCTNCTSPEACETWLQSRDTADTTPSYCRNGEKLQSLRKR